MFKKLLTFVYNKIYYPVTPNLKNDRVVEYGFVAANIDDIQNRKLKALDFGSGNGQLSLVAAIKGHNTLAIDLVDQHFPYKHPKVRFQKKDLFSFKRKSSFDLIINCSTIEHAGLEGRYGITEGKRDDDINAMRLLSGLLKKSGKMVLTLPVGKDGVFGNRHRVYGKIRLPELLEGWNIVREEYWTKNKDVWFECSRHKALRTKSSAHFYSLGCFVLVKKH